MRLLERYLLAGFDPAELTGLELHRLRSITGSILGLGAIAVFFLVHSLMLGLPFQAGALTLGLLMAEGGYLLTAKTGRVAYAGHAVTGALMVVLVGQAFVTGGFRNPQFAWFVVAPLSVRLFGYFPGRRLRKVGDLPRGVMEQWRRWCLNPEYAVGVEGEAARALYAAVRTPIVSLSFTDDEFMSLRNTESIHGQYANARRTMKRIAPKEIGEKRIGHFGFFKPKFEHSLWRNYLLPELAG